MAWDDVYWVEPAGDPEAFWEAVDQDPSMVVVLELVERGERKAGLEVFSSVERLRAHVDRQDIDGAVIYAKRIDEPDWPDRAH